MSDPRMCRKVTSALKFKEEMETSCLQKLLLTDPERYRTLLLDRNQDDAQLALSLPGNLLHEIHDLPREQQRIFHMYIGYRVSSGMSIRTALDMIETAVNSFLDQL